MQQTGAMLDGVIVGGWWYIYAVYGVVWGSIIAYTLYLSWCDLKMHPQS